MNTDANTLTNQIISAAIEVHRQLGPGLLLNFNVTVMKNGVDRIFTLRVFVVQGCS